MFALVVDKAQKIRDIKHQPTLGLFWKINVKGNIKAFKEQ